MNQLGHKIGHRTGHGADGSAQVRLGESGSVSGDLKLALLDDDHSFDATQHNEHVFGASKEDADLLDLHLEDEYDETDKISGGECGLASALSQGIYLKT